MFTIAPKTKQSYLFWLPYSGLGKGCCWNLPRECMQWDALAFLPHPTDITDITDIATPPPTIRLCSLRSAGLVKRSRPAPDQWLWGSDGCLLGPDSLPLWLCRVCALCCWGCFFLFSHCLPKEHSLGGYFFSSLSSCKCCIFLQFYLHCTTDYTCMIVYVTNNKEPWCNKIEHSC